MTKTVICFLALLSCATGTYQVSLGATHLTPAFITFTGPGIVAIDYVTCELSDGESTACLELTSTAEADHEVGPWCRGGNWVNEVIDAEPHSCTMQIEVVGCLECPVRPILNVYTFPLFPRQHPQPRCTNALGAGNSFGDAVAVNGVPLTKPDPIDVLTELGNQAPLDWWGGHATRRGAYHYHAVPTRQIMASFTGAMGYVYDTEAGGEWLQAAPDEQHSPIIGWAFDGFPIYGIYSLGGAIPADLDDCYGHTHEDVGYHYHAKDAHDGTTHGFLGGYHGTIATQDDTTVTQEGSGRQQRQSSPPQAETPSPAITIIGATPTTQPTSSPTTAAPTTPEPSSPPQEETPSPTTAESSPDSAASNESASGSSDGVTVATTSPRLWLVAVLGLQVVFLFRVAR